MGTFMTLIRNGLLYPSIHNSFITNKNGLKWNWHNIWCVQCMCIMLFQMFIYFGGPTEWWEKLMSC